MLSVSAAVLAPSEHALWNLDLHLVSLADVAHLRAAADRDGGFAVHDLDEGVVGRGVFAQLLPGVEGEQRDVAGLTLEDDPADDRSVLIRDQVPDATYLRLLVHVWTLRQEPTFLSPTYNGDFEAEFKLTEYRDEYQEELQRISSEFRAMREGVSRDGSALFPQMPYLSL